MPYIPQEDRQAIDTSLKEVGAQWNPQNAGEMNYTMTIFMDNYIKAQGGVRYTHLNDLIGAIEYAKHVMTGDIPKDPYDIDDEQITEMMVDVKEHGLSWTPKSVEVLCEFIIPTLIDAKWSPLVKFGVLECCKLELYRLIAGPYEDKKLDENGPAYTINPLGGVAY